MARRGKRGLRIEQLLRETAAPVFFLNADCEIAFLNAACETLLGRPADQVIGLRCRYHGPTGAADPPDLAASLAPPPEVMGGVPVTLRTIIIQPDGARIWRQIHFFPYNDVAQSCVMIMAVIASDNDALPPASLQADLHEGLLRLRARLYDRFKIDRLIGSNDVMDRVLTQVRLAVRSDASVLIWGEPGTGKETVARIIHAESERKSAPFIPVDCALLPANLTETDLVGMERPPLHGAVPGTQGPIRSAQGGTLLLKNVSYMPRDTQSALLNMLRVTGLPPRTQPKKNAINARLIATDLSDPTKLVGENGLRPDLYYLLTTIVIALPPLRERKADIPLLAQMFVEDCNADGTKQMSGLSADAIEVLLAYDWPGNIRELRDVITQAHAESSSSVINAGNLTPRIQGAQGGGFTNTEPDSRIDLDAALAETERRLIEQAIKRARGNKSVAAELLSITRPRLYRRMQMLGMDDAGEGVI